MRQAAGGLRYPRCPAALWASGSVYTTWNASQAGGSRPPVLYQHTRSFGPATLAGGSVKARRGQAVIRAVCCLHLESNRDDGSSLTAPALRSWDAPGSQAVQARKLPVSQDARYHTDGMVFLKVGRCQGVKRPFVLNTGREWGPRHPVGRGEGIAGQQDLAAAVTRWC